MSAPVDELDVGHAPLVRPPWHDWSRRRRWVGAVLVLAVVLAAVVSWQLLHRPAPPTPLARDTTPGADVVRAVDPDTTKCPAGRSCSYRAQVDPGIEAAFRAAFVSAGYIGRQTVVDDATGEIYWEYLTFTTGTLVTVTLTLQAVSELAAPPVTDDVPDDLQRKYGSVTLSVVRGGYLVTALAAGLPGQTLPVSAAEQWVHAVPAP